MKAQAERIQNASKAAARLLRILAVDGYAYTSEIKRWVGDGLTTRQINWLLRRTGKATMTRDRFFGDNDYLWKLNESLEEKKAA